MKKDISKKLFWQGIVLLIIVRIFIVVFFMVREPYLSGLTYDGLIPITRTGDESLYYQQAKKILNFDFSDQYGLRAVGTAIYYSVFLFLTGIPDNERGSYWLIFPIQSLFMYSISIIATVLISAILMGKKIKGLIVGVLYLLYPYGVYLLNLGPYKHNYSNFLDAMWFKSFLSDAPSAFFIYLAILFFVFQWDVNGKRKYKNIIISGIFAGIATLIRLTNVLACVAMGATLLLRKKYKELLIFFVFSFGVFTIQLAHNKYNYGHFFSFGYFSKETTEKLMEHFREIKEKDRTDDRINKFNIDPGNYFYLLTVLDKYIPALKLVLVIVISLFVSIFYYFYRFDKFKAIFVFLWIFLYFLLYGAFAPAARNLRYWLPVIPAVLILFVIFLDMIKNLTQSVLKLLYKIKLYD